MTDEEGLCISHFNGRLRFEGGGSSYFKFAYIIEPDNGYVPFPLLTPDCTENRAEIDCDSLQALPVLAPGSAASAETAVGINVFHCVHGHSDELLLRETAKSLGVEPLGTLRPALALLWRKVTASLSPAVLSHVLQRNWDGSSLT